MPTKKSPHIYILHGWAIDQNNAHKWQPLMDRLVELGVKTTFLGIPGLSSPLNEVWNLQDFVDWLSKQLPKGKKVILLGHSFGGQIAIRFATQNPDRVKKLILVDSAGIRDHSLKAVVKRKGFWVAAKIGKLLFNFEWARKLLYLFARERDYKNAPPLLKRSMSLVLDDEIVDDLQYITCPTLLIWGEKDKVTPLKFGRQKNSLIKQSQLEIITDARHSPQFTHVRKVAVLISKFVTT